VGLVGFFVDEVAFEVKVVVVRAGGERPVRFGAA
jgi:hypothetical protein